jgi:sporulation integral membrane protein YtvI
VHKKIEDRKSFIISVLYYAVVVALIYLAFRYVFWLVLPFLIGLVIAFILKPAVRVISRKLRTPRKLTALILSLLFYLVVGALLALVGMRIIAYIRSIVVNAPTIYATYLQPSLVELFENLQDLSARLDPALAQYIETATASMTSSISQLVTSLSSTLIRSVSVTVAALPSIFLTIVLSIISTVFFAMDFELIGEYSKRWLPERVTLFLHKLKDFLVSTVLKYIKSYMILMVITFVELSAGFLILGIEYAIGLAALIALIDLLPVLGTGGVLIPWLIINIILGNYGLAISLLVLYVVITVIRNILEPKIIGQQIGVHPLAMLVSMYVGLRLFGFVGVFAMPILLVVIKGFRESGFFINPVAPPDEAPSGEAGQKDTRSDAGQEDAVHDEATTDEAAGEIAVMPPVSAGRTVSSSGENAVTEVAQ